MTLRLGDIAPDFTAETTEGEITFHEWKNGTWAVLFSHPADFTPVCTTELGRTAALQSEFAARNVKTIAVSVDPLDSHSGWAGDIGDVGGTDLTSGHMIHPGEGDTSTVRSVFIIDPNNKVRLQLTYPKSVGRNFDEILRVIDALQLTDQFTIATPVDWRPGDRVVVSPTVSTEDAQEKFANVEVVKPYLRFADAPNA